MLVGLEERYSATNKVCLTLIFAIQRLRHYLQHHQTSLISKRRSPQIHPLLVHPEWAVSKMGSPTTAVQHQIHALEGDKGKIFIDFLAAQPIRDGSPLATDLLDKEVMTIAPHK